MFPHFIHTNEDTTPRTRLPTPRALVAHDLSCFGRCALTVVIPTLAVMGVQPVPLPTALLSTHTGGFTGFSMRDTTPDMRDILTHWETLGLSFDAVYTGFLGGVEQTGVIADMLGYLGNAVFKLIDPVLGDDGRLYSTITPKLVEGMCGLAASADLITPNLTEAYLLLGKDPASAHAPHTGEQIEKIIESLRERFSPAVIITGIHSDEGGETPHPAVSTACYDGDNFKLITRPRVMGSYPGTGDIFASVLLGRLFSGMTLIKAAESASDFTREIIAETSLAGTPAREGVLLEKNLYRLIERREQ